MPLATVDEKPGLGALIGAGLGQGVSEGYASGNEYSKKLGLEKAKHEQIFNMMNKFRQMRQQQERGGSAQQPPTELSQEEMTSIAAEARQIIGDQPATPEQKQAIVHDILKKRHMAQGGGEQGGGEQEAAEPTPPGDENRELGEAYAMAGYPQEGRVFVEAGKTQHKDVNESWARHQKYIDEQSDKYREGKSTVEKLELQKRLVATGKMPSPTLAYLAETFGVDPIGYNDATQLYEKVKADLTGGFTKWVGTAKSSLPEFNIFLKKFATLKNTDAGKNLILDFQLAEQRLKNIEAQVTMDLTDKYAKNNQPVPHNFRNIVNREVDRQYQKEGVNLRNIMDRADSLEKKGAKAQLAPGEVLMRYPGQKPRAVKKSDVKAATQAGYVIE